MHANDPGYRRRRPAGRQGARSPRKENCRASDFRARPQGIEYPSGCARRTGTQGTLRIPTIPQAGRSRHQCTDRQVAGRRRLLMRALLDVNVLIALLDADHSLHMRATKWFVDHARAGWASCPITENGCMRIMSHPAYPNPAPVRAVMERLQEAGANSVHEFWPDDISLLDPRVADSARIHGPHQLTDLYLLALAVRHRGQFVTFDSSVARDAIVGAERRHMLVL